MIPNIIQKIIFNFWIFFYDPFNFNNDKHNLFYLTSEINKCRNDINENNINWGGDGS